MQTNAVPGVTCRHNCRCGTHVPMSVLMPEVVRRRRITARASAAKPAARLFPCPTCQKEAAIDPNLELPGVATCPHCGGDVQIGADGTLTPLKPMVAPFPTPDSRTLSSTASFAEKERLNRLVRGIQAKEPGTTYEAALRRLTRRTA